MIDDARDKFYNLTVAEWLEPLPYELKDDAIGLFTIIPAGRHDFGLTGSDLIEFIHRALLVLLSHGAKPVHGSGNSAFGWRIAEGYGETQEQIAQTVIDRWLL
jgi:hypothetical protein